LLLFVSISLELELRELPAEEGGVEEVEEEERGLVVEEGGGEVAEWELELRGLPEGGGVVPFNEEEEELRSRELRLGVERMGRPFLGGGGKKR
jgi:hypothetical protein